MNQYTLSLVSAMTSKVDKRANKITALEMFREGYRALGRSKAKRDVEQELEELRLAQHIEKRAIGAIVQQSRYINYLEEYVAQYEVDFGADQLDIDNTIPEIWEEGTYAYLEGLAREDNPYPYEFYPEAYMNWDGGYRYAAPEEDEE